MAEEGKEKKIKTTKAFKRGKGIEEQVLYDDAFDWDSISEVPEELPEERKAELDEFDLSEQPLEIQPEEKTEQPAPKREEPPAEPGPPKKRIPFLWIAVGAVLLAAAGVGGMRFFASRKPAPVLPPSYAVTRAILPPANVEMKLEPFVVPAPAGGRDRFVRIQIRLVLKPLSEPLVTRHMSRIRKILYERLRQAWKHPFPRLSPPRLIREINRQLETPCVLDMAWAVLPYEEKPGTSS